MFKTDPKTQVSVRYRELFGKERKPVVSGYRLSPLQSKLAGYPEGSYVSELIVDGQLLAVAHSTDWRQSYKLLKVEVDNLYKVRVTAK